MVREVNYAESGIDAEICYNGIILKRRIQLNG